MNRFDNLRKELRENLPSPKKIDIRTINFTMTISGFLEDLTRKIRELPPGPQLDDYVECTAPRFFQIIKTTKPDSDYFVQIDWILNNLDYITTLVNVMSKNRGMVDDTMSLVCNELYYDYATQVQRDPDPRLLGAYMMLTRVINSKLITVLSGIVPMDTAINLAAAANSSIIDEIQIRRVNWVIVQNGPNIMTPNNICKIYEAIFRHMGPLFTYTMMDVCADPQDQNELEAFDQVNSNIELALLAMLNEMPINSIYQILWIYATTFTSRLNLGAKFRFRIEALNAQEYGRILTAVNMIRPIVYKYGLVLP